MAEKKKQHFVPKLLLRYFSSDSNEKLISIFNVDSRKYISSGALKSQCQESYVYGEDKEVENVLGEIENGAAPIIKSIIENKALPKHGSEEFLILFFFGLLLAARTKYAADHSNDVLNKTFREIGKHDKRFEQFKEGGLQVKNRYAAAISVQVAMEAISLSLDLSLKLLVNNSKTKFITSDNPSIRYNQFLEKINYPGGHLGFLTKGLQTFLPLSPDIMLVYYDKWAYKFGNKNDKIIEIKDEKDIEQLNYLQIVNCSEIVYTNNTISEYYLSTLANRAVKLRNQDFTGINEINNRFKDANGNLHIQYTQYGIDRKTKLELSFAKQTKNAKSHQFNDYVLQYRNEKLRGYNLY